ncbi:MAG: class II fructose-bisphosphate aldolase [Pseudomonadota bacterium]
MIKPGVVTGKDYRALINACKAGQYALPAVNVVGTNSINAVLEAAAKHKSDVIIQLSNGGAEFYAGKGCPDAHQAKVLGAISAASHVHMMAQIYGVCVVLHTDHANRKLLPWVDALVQYSENLYRTTGRPLFSSHMIDLSEESLEENVATCLPFLKRLAAIDMSLEIELGVTGGEEDGVGSDDIDNARLYTQPEDVLCAYDQLASIGHFSVAASFGNVHGVYAPGNVKLRPDILKNTQSLIAAQRGTVANPLDLVFHGGSGSDKAHIAESLRYGVFKMNIDTDTQFAFSAPVGAYVAENARAFQCQIDPDTHTPYKKQYDPRQWLRAGEKGIVDRMGEAFADLGSSGRTIAG